MIRFANETSEYPRLVQVDVCGERHVREYERYISDRQMKQVALGYVGKLVIFGYAEYDESVALKDIDEIV